MVDRFDSYSDSGDPDRRARGREMLARFRPLITAEESSSNNRLVDALMTKSDPGDLPNLLAKTVNDHGEDAVCEICDLFDKTSRRSPPMASKLLSGFKDKLAGAPEMLKPARFRGLAAKPTSNPTPGPTRLDDMLAGMEDLVETDGGRNPLPEVHLLATVGKTRDISLAGMINRSTQPSSNEATKVAMNTKSPPVDASPGANAVASSKAPSPPSDADKLFNKYRQNLKPREGGFADRSNDRGGPTQKGMSQKALDPLRKRSKWKHLPANAKNLTDAQINRIFREEYFDRLRIDKLEKVGGLSSSAPKFAEQVFDIGILHGIGKAGTWLQKSLDDVLGTDLRISEDGRTFYDGNVGPATRKVVEQAVRSGKSRQVHNAIVDKRLKWMTASPDLKNNPGWLPRAESFRMKPVLP